MQCIRAENRMPHSLHRYLSDVINVLLLLVLFITIVITCKSFSKRPLINKPRFTFLSPECCQMSVEPLEWHRCKFEFMPAINKGNQDMCLMVLSCLSGIDESLSSFIAMAVPVC
jgi:hypothetical protein